MKNYIEKLLIILTLFFAFGCGEKTRDENEIYFDAKNFIHYDSKTGKPFTGIVKKTGPYPWNKIIENKYVNGNGVQFTWKNKKGTTRAILKYDGNSNIVGELYYSNSGQLVSKSEWEELNQKEGW